jgi:hypothetical protein
MRLTQFIFPDEDLFRHACESPRAPWWVTGFIVALGALYGAAVAAFQQTLGGELQGIPIAEFPAYILYGGNMLAGALIVLAGHLGFAVIAWMMARAAGGPGHMAAIYRTTAYLLPLVAPAVPFIAMTSTVPPDMRAALPLQVLYLPLAGLSVALVLNGLFTLYRIVQGVSPVRAGLGTALFALFLTSILLLV